MKSHCVFERKEGYLSLTISGEYDKEEFMSYPKMVVEACQEEKIFKVLVNALDLSGTDIPGMDRFFMGENIAAQLGSAIKLAVAWPERHIDNFAENVAVNRGSLTKVVGDIETAKEWLLSLS